MVKVVKSLYLNLEIYFEESAEVGLNDRNVKFAIATDGIETFFVNKEDAMKIIDMVKSSGVTKEKKQYKPREKKEQVTEEVSEPEKEKKEYTPVPGRPKPWKYMNKEERDEYKKKQIEKARKLEVAKEQEPWKFRS